MSSFMMLDECVEGESGCIGEDSFVCLRLGLVSKGNGSMGDPCGE